MPYYAADSDSLFYEERGAGDMVVVLGGGPARHPDYLEDLAGLTERYTLVVPHLRGVGRTPLPSDPANGSWWNQARDLEALRLHLSRERLTVLGHSAGTRIGLAYAARFPEALERLVLITPPAADLVDVPSDIDAIRDRRTSDPVYAAAMKAARQGPPADSDDDALTAWQRTSAHRIRLRHDSHPRLSRSRRTSGSRRTASRTGSAEPMSTRAPSPGSRPPRRRRSGN